MPSACAGCHTKFRIIVLALPASLGCRPPSLSRASPRQPPDGKDLADEAVSARPMRRPGVLRAHNEHDRARGRVGHGAIRRPDPVGHDRRAHDEARAAERPRRPDRRRDRRRGRGPHRRPAAPRTARLAHDRPHDDRRDRALPPAPPAPRGRQRAGPRPRRRHVRDPVPRSSERLPPHVRVVVRAGPVRQPPGLRRAAVGLRPRRRPQVAAVRDARDAAQGRPHRPGPRRGSRPVRRAGASSTSRRR